MKWVILIAVLFILFTLIIENFRLLILVGVLFLGYLWISEKVKVSRKRRETVKRLVEEEKSQTIHIKEKESAKESLDMCEFPKDYEQARKVQKEYMFKECTSNYAGAAWSRWWLEEKQNFLDLESMLEVARFACQRKNPIAVAMMEDVQLALVGGLANNASKEEQKVFWKRLELEPYALYHMWKHKLGTEETYKYVIQKRCWFAVEEQAVGGKYKKILNNLEDDARKRLASPVKVEIEAQNRAKRIWDLVSQFEKGKSMISQNEITQGIELIEKVASEGWQAAQLWLLEYRATSEKDPSALYMLGEAYELGSFALKLNRAKEVQLYKESAEKGYVPAQYKYAFCLETGKYGVTRDLDKAQALYRSAAEQEHPEAAVCYAKLVSKNKGLSIEAERYIDRIIEIYGNGETREIRKTLRTALALKIGYSLSDEWSAFKVTKKIYKPDKSTNDCYSMALAYVKSELIDMQMGYMKPTRRMQEDDPIKWYSMRVALSEENNIDALHDLLSEFGVRINKSVSKCEDQKIKKMGTYPWNLYKQQHSGYIQELLEECRENIWEWNLIGGALLQYAASLCWAEAEANDVKACHQLLKLYRHSRLYMDKVGEYWYKKALETNTAEGYYVGGYYGEFYGMGMVSCQEYLQKASMMGYVEAEKELRSLYRMQEAKAEAERINNMTPKWMKSINTTQKLNDSKEQEDRESWNSVLSIPDIIYGPNNNIYKRLSISSYSAEYWCDETGESTTIHNSDIGMGGRNARTSEGYFWW